MAKSSLIAAFTVAAFLFVQSLVVGSAQVPKEFMVQGRVFCDTCRAGFETPATTYVAGAKVRVECRTRDTNKQTCSYDGVADSTGTFNVQVPQKHECEICDAVLVSSPDSACSLPVMGREKATVILTDNNGIESSLRVVNALGFQKHAPLPWCAELMKMYDDIDFPFA